MSDHFIVRGQRSDIIWGKENVLDFTQPNLSDV